MAANERVFVDSNFFIAFFNTADALHQQALTAGKALTAAGNYLIISNFVFLETVTVLSQRVGKQTAQQVGAYLLSDPYLQIIHIDPALQAHTWRIFQEATNKNVSFVDCSNLAVIQAESIPYLLTFDVPDFKVLMKKYRCQLYDIT